MRSQSIIRINLKTLVALMVKLGLCSPIVFVKVIQYQICTQFMKIQFWARHYALVFFRMGVKGFEVRASSFSIIMDGAVLPMKSIKQCEHFPFFLFFFVLGCVLIKFNIISFKINGAFIFLFLFILVSCIISTTFYRVPLRILNISKRNLK